nr:TOBE domain-containing protein [Rhizobium tibeticum]
MGEANFVPAKVKSVDVAGAKLETPIGSIVIARSNFTGGIPVEGRAVTLCIRPEHFRHATEAVEPGTALGEAVVTGIAFFGTHYRCHLKAVDAPGLSIVAHMPQSAELAEGARVALAVNPSDIVALPAHGRN